MKSHPRPEIVQNQLQNQPPVNSYDEMDSSLNEKESIGFGAIANESPQAQKLTQLQAIANGGSHQSGPIQGAKNETGLPDQLKSGVEKLGGFSMDDVRVHYNSSKPAQLKAHAFAQGTEIHLAPGQEQHLAHEAWHVVQQKQGRVKPMLQLKGIALNDDSSLEREADVMGEKALGGKIAFSNELQTQFGVQTEAVQRVRVTDSADGSETETADLWAEGRYEEIVALALRFYSLHNMDNLALIQQAHQNDLSEHGYDISDDGLDQMARPASIAPKKVVPLKAKAQDDDAKVDLQSDETDVQEYLTDDYWKEQLIAKYGPEKGQEAYLRVKASKKFWDAPKKRAKAAKLPKRRLDDIIGLAPSILEQLEQVGQASKSQLRIYRGMKKKEAEAIMRVFNGKSADIEKLLHSKPKSADLRKAGGILPVDGHLAGREQANEYAQGDDEALLEFVLKPGAHLLLFSPAFMALAPAGKGTGGMLLELLGDFPLGNASEGNLPGYVGLKSEKKGDFSLTVQNDTTKLLFQLLIESINVVDVVKKKK